MKKAASGCDPRRPADHQHNSEGAKVTDTNILTFPPCEISEETDVPVVQCAYTALTRFGTEQCDLPVENAKSVDQDEREFCTGHCADVKRNEVEDRYIDADYS